MYSASSIITLEKFLSKCIYILICKSSPKIFQKDTNISYQIVLFTITIIHQVLTIAHFKNSLTYPSKDIDMTFLIDRIIIVLICRIHQLKLSAANVVV